MKRIITLVITAIFMFAFIGNTVNAAEANQNAAELCKSVNTWEEYKEAFEDFQYVRGDFLGSVLKNLPERIAKVSTYSGFGYGGIEDERLSEFVDCITYAISLYSNSEIGHLKFSIDIEDLEGPYSQVDVTTEDIPLSHIGNVVKCYEIPYYSNINEYMEDKNANYYEGQILCYTCGVAYWNSDGTLEKMEYIPFEEVAQLKDEEKPKIDREFDGNILILLCTTDTFLGWTSLDGLSQYEDSMGNMEFYNPDFISYS